jgi:hypothetical protein
MKHTVFTNGCSFVLCFFFWVVLRRMEFKCQRFGMFCLFCLHRAQSVTVVEKFVVREQVQTID